MAKQIEKLWISPPLPSGLKIRHLGYLDLSEFYTWLKRWFEFNGYLHDNFEKFYEERTLPTGKEMHIRWEGRKKQTPYFTYVIEVIWLLISVNKVEIPMGDKKRKIEKGDFELRLGAYIEKKGPANMFRKIYEYFIIRKTIRENWYKLNDKFSSLQEEIKTYFNQYVQ